MNENRSGDRFLLIGAGIASLAAAAFLIRDAGVPGARIRIIEAGPRPGGALLSGHLPEHQELFLGNAVRSMDEKADTCLWDLLASVPTLADPRTSVLDDIRAANSESPDDGAAQLIDADHRVTAPDLRLAPADRQALLALLTRAETAELAGRRIEQVLPEHLLDSDFWIMWSATRRLRPGSSALDLKTSLLRHLYDPPRLNELAGMHRTRRSEYESIIRPLHDWLLTRGVVFTHGATVTDMDVADDGAAGRRAMRLRLTTRGTSNSVELGPHDHVLATLGSMTADAAYGDDENPPELDVVHRDGTWRLWESLARRQPDFGRPQAFTTRVHDTAWLAFTLSMTSQDLSWHVSHLTGDPDGTGGPLVFRDSPWLLTLAVPHQQHFTGQGPYTRTALGYGMRLDVRGDHVPVTMREASGRQLVDELIGQLGIERGAAVVRMTTSVNSVLLPYAGSPLAPRSPGDRPDPVPPGARNFAFLGQYVEIAGDIAFSMDYSVRSAMHAVYGLLGLEREIPATHRAIRDSDSARRALEAVYA